MRVTLTNRFREAGDDTLDTHERLAAGREGRRFCIDYQRDWIKLLREAVPEAAEGDEAVERLQDIDTQYDGESAAWKSIVDDANEALRIEELRRIARVRQKGRDKVLKAVARTREKNWDSFVSAINGYERNPKSLPSVGDWDGLEGEYFVLEEDAEDAELNPRPAEEPPAPLNTVQPASVQPFAVDLDELKTTILEELDVVEAIEDETGRCEVDKVAHFFCEYRNHASDEDADELKTAIEQRIGNFLDEKGEAPEPEPEPEPEPKPEPKPEPQPPAAGVATANRGAGETIDDVEDDIERLDIPATAGALSPPAVDKAEACGEQLCIVRRALAELPADAADSERDKLAGIVAELEQDLEYLKRPAPAAGYQPLEEYQATDAAANPETP